MPRSKIILHSLLHALGVGAYIIMVALLMNNGERLFGSMNNLWGPAALLLLFTVSAAITGLLVFGRPVYLFLNGQKKEALQFLFFTIGWLIIFTIATFIVLLMTYQPYLTL